jgi:histidine ammonia-lyase
VAAAYAAVRDVLPVQEEDRPLAPEIERVRDLVRSGALITAAEAATSPLRGI